MGNKFYVVLASLLAATSVATCTHVSSLKNANVLKTDAKDTTTTAVTDITKLSFVSSMGCNDLDCTDPTHYHSCSDTCTDLDHYHDCDETCNHAVGQHHGENYCTQHHLYDTCGTYQNSTNSHHGTHHKGNHCHH